MKPLNHKDRVKRIEHWERTGRDNPQPQRRSFENTAIVRPRLTITQARKAIKKRIADAWDRI